MKPIGKVTHYYGKLGVAIIKLQDELKLGDRIRIDQEVASLHKNYQPIERAGAGDEVGVKVAEKTQEGAIVVLLGEGE